MEPKEFRQPTAQPSQQVQPAPGRAKYGTKTIRDLQTGPWTNLFNSTQKVPMSDQLVPMNAIRTEEWSRLIKMTNEPV